MSNAKTQIKFKIDTDIVSAFKARCASGGVSMTSVVRDWMKTRYPVKEVKVKTLTRPERKRAVMTIIGLLNDILENEEYYRDSIPEQFTQRFEDADHFCEKLAEAIGCLEDAF
jgi:hypothetical protein